MYGRPVILSTTRKLSQKLVYWGERLEAARARRGAGIWLGHIEHKT
jgi:hypothetical protein